MWVMLELLIGDMFLVGVLFVFFFRKLFLEINWIGLMNFLDIFGLNGLLDIIILDMILNYLVFFN